MTEPKQDAFSTEDFERISSLLYRWTGMIFGPKKRYYLERRLIRRMECTGSTNFGNYLAILMSRFEERQELVNLVTVNETYFYREDHQLAALSNQILPDIVRRREPGDLVRIWSIPCSTGEESYSIAIWLLENWPLVDAYNIEIIGSDIDTKVIELARKGFYAARAMARLPEALCSAYFEPEHRHHRQIIEDLRESVQFNIVNIVDPTSVSAHGRFDVIFCRNLLIYFDEAARRSAAANLFDALNPGGYLCLGHSESMTRIDDRFTLVRLDDAIVYRRD